MANPEQPLADRLRPQRLEDIAGQGAILADNSFLSHTIASGKPASIVLWGPPGTGKTTLARLYAAAFDAEFIQISAVFSGVADIKKIVGDAKKSALSTVLFVDEIHRFNKSQQDAFLPYVENGTIILVGATTENPSFSLNNALLSRAQVLTLQPLDREALAKLLERAEKVEGKLPLTLDAREALLSFAHGDGRYLLTMVESVYKAGSKKELSANALSSLVQRKSALYDKGGDGHYNLISAFHKSIRGSDPDAALYWLARMLTAGEEPLYLARRLIRIAAEDIGLADPQALGVCQQALEAYKNIGSPEGDLILAQAAVYLALAPKSNAIYDAYKKAIAEAKNSGELSPPAHILNAPTKLMKKQGYGEGYIYDHNTPQAFSGQNYFPDSMKRPSFYHPAERGFERDMLKRVTYFKSLRDKLNQ